MLSSRPLVLESLEPRSLLAAICNGSDAVLAPRLAETTIQPAAVARAAAATDDAYENNDTFALAANLGTLSLAKTTSNLVMNDAVDWFKFKMNAAGTSSDFVKLAFTHIRGDLDLELYNASGRLLSRSQSVTNAEQLSLKNLAAGTYYLRAYGYRGVRNPAYSLTIDPGASVAPVATPVPAPAPTPIPTPTPAPTVGAFDIELNFQGLTTNERAIFQQAAARWEQIIVGDLPSATFNGRLVDDLLIDASAIAIDGIGGTLGQAGPDRFRSGTLMPYHGSMQFDTADLADMLADGSLLSVIEHEIGHILGIGTLWDERGLLTGAGTSNPRYTGTQATAQYNALFGLQETGIPVENSGGAGTRDSHWRDSVFTNELMTGWAGPGTSLPLSRITVASLADLGYQVDISRATPYSRPSAAAVPPPASTAAISAVVALDAAYHRDRRAIDDVMSLWE